MEEIPRKEQPPANQSDTSPKPNLQLITKQFFPVLRHHLQSTSQAIINSWENDMSQKLKSFSEEKNNQPNQQKVKELLFVQGNELLKEFINLTQNSWSNTIKTCFPTTSAGYLLQNREKKNPFGPITRQILNKFKKDIAINLSTPLQPQNSNLEFSENKINLSEVADYASQNISPRNLLIN